MRELLEDVSGNPILLRGRAVVRPRPVTPTAVGLGLRAAVTDVAEEDSGAWAQRDEDLGPQGGSAGRDVAMSS